MLFRLFLIGFSMVLAIILHIRTLTVNDVSIIHTQKGDDDLALPPISYP